MPFRVCLWQVDKSHVVTSPLNFSLPVYPLFRRMRNSADPARGRSAIPVSVWVGEYRWLSHWIALGTTAVLGRPVTGLSRNPDRLLPTRSLRQTSNPSELWPWCRSAAFVGDSGAAQNRRGNRKQLVSSPATTMPIKRLDVPNTPPPDHRIETQ